MGHFGCLRSVRNIAVLHLYCVRDVHRNCSFMKGAC